MLGFVKFISLSLLLFCITCFWVPSAFAASSSATNYESFVNQLNFCDVSLSSYNRDVLETRTISSLLRPADSVNTQYNEKVGESQEDLISCLWKKSNHPDELKELTVNEMFEVAFANGGTVDDKLVGYTMLKIPGTDSYKMFEEGPKLTKLHSKCKEMGGYFGIKGDEIDYDVARSYSSYKLGCSFYDAQ